MISLSFTAVIPLTDSNHDLLPLQFAIDPGDNFQWGRDELEETITSRMTILPNKHLHLLSCYLEMVKVALPDWLFEVDNGGKYKSGRGQGHAKGIGSIGKKLKKNLGKLARNGSFKCHSKQYHEEPRQKLANSTSAQPFILAALIHTNQAVPFQNEMVENYLEVCKLNTYLL